MAVGVVLASARLFVTSAPPALIENGHAQALASAVDEYEQTLGAVLETRKEQALEEAGPAPVDAQRERVRTQRLNALNARASELRRQIESLSHSSPPTPQK